MIACDRCKSFVARTYLYGDATNQNFVSADLCYDCARYFSNLLLHYKHGDNVVVNHSESEVLSDD